MSSSTQLCYDNYSTLPEMLTYVSNTFDNATAFNERVDGAWCPVSTHHFYAAVQALGRALVALGLKKGERVGIFAESSPDWLIIDQAIMAVGAVSVPFFTKVSSDQFAYQIQDAEINTLFVLGDQVEANLPLLMKNVEAPPAHLIRGKQALDELIKKEEEDDNAPDFPIVLPDDVATVIYTSGSTGVPKGVEITHMNLISQILGSAARFPIDASKRAFSCLPLAHVFERMVVYFYISTGGSIYFADDIHNVAALYPEVKAEITTMVPRILEKIYLKLKDKARAAGLLARGAFRLAHCSENSLVVKLFHPLADRLVYKKIRAALGGHMETVILGGAPLNERLCRFFLRVGVNIYQGYGQTESSPVIAANFEGRNKPGTVGPHFPGVEVKIGEEGEILTRGPHVMKGYLNQPEKTAEVVDGDGWLHTGDRGEIDAEGFLSVTGRLKEFLKTSSGKMVYPIPIEQRLSRCSIVDTALVIAEGKNFTSCLLFPDFDKIERLKRKEGKGGMTTEAFLDHQIVRNKIHKMLRRVNTHFNHWEQVKAYRFVCQSPTIEGGELTPTLKIRRNAVLEKYSALVDAMYTDTEGVSS